jgi:hypothetical protein
MRDLDSEWFVHAFSVLRCLPRPLEDEGRRQTDSVVLLGSTGVEAQTIVENSGRGLWNGIKHFPQQALAQEILAHGLHALAERRIARHQRAMGVLPARVVLEYQRRVLDRGRIVVPTASDIREPREHNQVDVAETLALDDG